MHAAHAIYSPARPNLLAVLRRLTNIVVEADTRHRERCKLAEMPDERLRDMGLPLRERSSSLPFAQLR